MEPIYTTNWWGWLGIGILIIQLIIDVFLGYCQIILSKKLNVNYSWMAFIPVLSGINLLWIAGKSLGKYIGLSVLFVVMIIAWPLLAMWVGPIGWISAIIGGFGLFWLSLAILDGVAKRTGHGFFWALGLLFLYPIMLPITAFTYKGSTQIT